jgi:NTP pyrophosphatase (non-canonical NTP hydrolase)
MPISFQEFSEANRLRCESRKGFNHQLEEWSASDWMTAVVGELGEAANVIKKLNRIRDGIHGNKIGEERQHLINKLRHELGDAFIYLDLLCQALGYSIDSAAVEAFNAKSAEIGYPEKLSR